MIDIMTVTCYQIQFKLSKCTTNTQVVLLALFQLSSIEYLDNSTLLTLRPFSLRTLTMMEVDQVSKS